MEREISTIIDSIAFESIDKHPNILIAAKFWDESRYNAARVCYRFMRRIDDFIDNRKAMDQTITCVEKQVMTEELNRWLGCLDHASNGDPFFRELIQTVEHFKIPLQLFRNFARSMFFDLDHNGFSTLNEFIDYAEGSSVAPASIFVHLCSLSKENNVHMPADFDVIEMARPCALFSYIVHIIRDFQEDQRNNLNYFAEDVLLKYGLFPVDLKKIAGGGGVPESFRKVIQEYWRYAQHYREQTLVNLDYLSTKLNGHYLLSLHIIYHLYKQVFDRIDPERGQFTTYELNPTPREIKNKVLEIISKWQ